MTYDASKVTPRPWPEGGPARMTSADGKHAIHCVNTHEALVAALEAAESYIEPMTANPASYSNGTRAVFGQVVAALARARGEQ